MGTRFYLPIKTLTDTGRLQGSVHAHCTELKQEFCYIVAIQTHKDKLTLSSDMNSHQSGYSISALLKNNDLIPYVEKSNT